MEKKVRKKYDMPLTDAVELKLKSILMGSQQEGDQPGGGDD